MSEFCMESCCMGAGGGGSCPPQSLAEEDVEGEGRGWLWVGEMEISVILVHVM